ncbi:uncharacterized protein LOC125237225 isoform X1 [Leguminivora glycinivorella]|uniref:uncharacterized protein LOC125237225 isoform X1 n=1 Tax=Leguminivora glycinivorella TaxID=1035111 RepID=UPI00200FD5D2|nr:uncharacterized protein LOC125237225 isoform X1 [Leguminivora glycinivorella]
MKTWTIAFVISTIICIANGYFTRPSRYRREVGGTLEIVSKNVQPIHADVKSEMTVTEQLTSGSTRCTFESPTETTEVPCSTGYVPSQIEPGIVFKVTPPATIFQQSLRKSLPVPSRLELIRSISRLAAVVALAFTALVELYPALAHLVNTLYSFIV